MKRSLRYSLWMGILVFGSILLGAGAVRLSAQEPVALEQPQADPGLSAHSPAVPTDLWLYMNEQRRHDDPQQAVRRKAGLKAEQRAERMAAMKWYGLSNSRPTASPIPSMGIYSPTWTGNGLLPYQWVNTGHARPVVRVDSRDARR